MLWKRTSQGSTRLIHPSCLFLSTVTCTSTISCDVHEAGECFAPPHQPSHGQGSSSSPRRPELHGHHSPAIVEERYCRFVPQPHRQQAYQDNSKAWYDNHNLLQFCFFSSLGLFETRLVKTDPRRRRWQAEASRQEEVHHQGRGARTVSSEPRLTISS